MSVDSQESPSPVSTPSPSASQSQGKILTADVYLHIRREEEKERYEKLKKQSFVLTPMFREEFMQEAGLDSEFS
jgi:crotonobetainyl-CoA:carnitine CoA-transferase CaiB-like acyl-CoA transferase